MKKKESRYKRYKNYILLTTTIVATLVIFLQNIEYLLDKTRKITQTIVKDIVVVDSFISGDTLDIRLINNGDKTIALSEAKFFVDSTWQIYENTEVSHFRFLVTNQYEVSLPDSAKSYEITHKLFQALKPNDVDRFQITLGSGKSVSNSNVYFILFRLQIMLNDGKDFIQFNPMIHALGLKTDTIDASHYNWINWFIMMKKSDVDLSEEYYNHYYSNKKNAINISRLPYYKSEKAKVLMERILTN